MPYDPDNNPDERDGDLPDELAAEHDRPPELATDRPAMAFAVPDKMERLIQALMTARTLKEAAGMAGIGYSTAKRIMATPEANARLAQLRTEATKEAVLEATNLARLARETLAAVMLDERTPAYARVQAASAALNYDRAISDLFSINERLAVIEQRLADQQHEEQAHAQAQGRTPAFEYKRVA